MSKIEEWAARAKRQCIIDSCTFGGTRQPKPGSAIVALTPLDHISATIRAFLAEAKADGWRMVPVEPTVRMTAASMGTQHHDRHNPLWVRCADSGNIDARDMGPAYTAMLAAAPDVTEEP